MYRKKRLVISFIIFSFAGIIITLILLKQQTNKDSHASSPDKLEAEGGVISGNAQTLTDSNASGGSYILLGNFGITAGPSSQNITSTTAEITWTLSEGATGQIEYGTTTSYGTLSALENTFTYLTHVQTLSGLTPGITYHYRVKSSNQAGQQVVSGDKSFVTLASSISSGIYGMGISGDSLANTPLGGPYLTSVQFMRFRATQTSSVTSFKFYYLGPPEPGYAGGTGGTWSAGIYNDDASADHLPTGSPIANVTNVAPQGIYTGEAGRLITLTTPVPLTAGKLYHLVFTNTDASPATNYFSPDFWNYGAIPDRNAGTTPYPTQIHPLMPNTDWGHGYKTNGGTWIIRQGYLPVLDLAYTNGQHQGWSYAEASYSGVDEIGEINGTSKLVREKITISGGDKIVTGVGIRLVRTSGSSALNIKLKNSNGVILDSVNIPASNIAVGPAPTFASNPSPDDLGAKGRYITGNFSTPKTLTNGYTYYLEISTAADTTYWAWVNRRLSSNPYLYDSSTYFKDGVAEYTRDGSTWANLGRSKGDQDLQFYFNLQ